jgi:hypothetical protein
VKSSQKKSQKFKRTYICGRTTKILARRVFYLQGVFSIYKEGFLFEFFYFNQIRPKILMKTNKEAQGPGAQLA